ncbi:MAG: permease [Brevinematales bacterium]|nr:permease [Brevinematales bacterium]
MLSFIVDKEKTLKGLLKGARMFLNLLPSFIVVLSLVAVVLTLLPKEVLIQLMGEQSGFLGFAIAAVFGSVTLIPGFVAYPLSAVLIKNGVSYPIIAVFITTLMMVGVVTLPLESKYFGWKPAILRNFFSLIAALLIGTLMAVLWGYL